MSAPLWLLDVDGVINAVTLDPAVMDQGYVIAPVMGFTITYRPALIERMRELHESGRVEIRWLTTWCDDAADRLAPVVGLPALAVEGDHDHRTVLKGWWKSVTAQRLSDADPVRPLIWTDDDLEYSERCGDVDWLAGRIGPTLAISPNDRTGLTDALMERIESFLAECESEAVA